MFFLNTNTTNYKSIFFRCNIVVSMQPLRIFSCFSRISLSIILSIPVWLMIVLFLCFVYYFLHFCQFLSHCPISICLIPFHHILFISGLCSTNYLNIELMTFVIIIVIVGKRESLTGRWTKWYYATLFFKIENSEPTINILYSDSTNFWNIRN